MEEDIITLNKPNFKSPNRVYLVSICYRILAALFNNVEDTHMEKNEVNVSFVNIFTGYGEFPWIYENKGTS